MPAPEIVTEVTDTDMDTDTVRGGVMVITKKILKKRKIESLIFLVKNENRKNDIKRCTRFHSNYFW